MNVEWAEQIEEQLGDPDSPPPGTRAAETRVKKADGWTVHTEEGYSFSIDKSQRFDADPPRAGDPITVHSLGTKVLGVDLRGERLYLKSEREDRLEWLLFRASWRRRRREVFARDRERLDREYEALPDVLRARIDRFRDADPEFRVEAEGYEMAAVADAPKIARAVGADLGEPGPDGYPTDVPAERAGAAMDEFRDLDYERQRELVPDLNEGHSGNTFGAATGLAYRLLTGQTC